MSINIRNNADLEVSTPYFFRQVSISTSSASNGFTYVSFSEPHYFKYGDSVAVNSFISKVNRLETDGTIEVDNFLTIRWNNDIPLANANLNISATITDTITQRKRENGLVTLQLDGAHRFEIGDVVTVSGLASGWNGTFTITAIPDSTKVRYADPRTESPTFTTDSGTISTTITRSTTSRSMTANVVTLNFGSAHRFETGDSISVGGSNIWIAGNYTVGSNVGTQYLTYSTAFSSINFGSAFGWTRPLYIDLAANGISNIVYPELPQVYSVTISPTTGLAVGTTLTATESVNAAYRYRSDTITYQWYRSSSLGNQGTLIASGKTYQLTNFDLNQYITVVVTGSNPKGSATASSSQLFFTGPLSAPTGLSVSLITATSASFSWNAVSGASSYEYAWGTSTTPTNWSSSGITSSNNVFSVPVSGMVSNTTYYFRVRGKRNSTDVDGSISSINFNTRFASPSVSAARNLASNSYNSDSGPYTATATEIDQFGRILITTTEPAGGRAATPLFYKIQSFYTSWADVGVFPYSNSTTTGVNFTTNTYLIPRASLLTGGREYQFRVAICDSTGNTLLSDWSSSTPNVRPFNAPSAPTFVSVSSGGDATNGNYLTINWNSNISSDEPVFGWAVTRTSDTLNDTRNWIHYLSSPSQNTHTFKNLSANTSYTLRVKALVGYTSVTSLSILFSNLNVVNAFSSNILSQTVTSSTTPGTPTSLTVTPNRSGSTPILNLSWAAPSSNGGAAITSYSYKYATSTTGLTSATWTDTGSSTTTASISSGLSLNTTYYVQVRANNYNGSSAASTSASGKTWNVPGAPASISATMGSDGTTATVTWTAATDTGGSSITGYRLQRTDSENVGTNWSSLVPGFTWNVTSLTKGTRWWFRIRTANDLGDGGILTANPPTVPTPPGSCTGSRILSTSFKVDWTAVGTNNGSAITGYTVERRKFVSGAWNSWTAVGSFSATTRTATVTSITTGTFQARVKGTNGVGDSDWTQSAQFTV